MLYSVEILPIGSVVRFKTWEQPLMIYGRKKEDSKPKKTWDYVACYYPIGNISKKYNSILNLHATPFIYPVKITSDIY
ncbi:DUF4176 domain-containing protein, partial [Bacillus sp. D-CC]